MSSPTAPIRIAFCITDLDPGGAERAMVKIVTQLDRKHWDPAVYCLSPPGDLVSVLKDAGIPVKCFGARGLRDLGVTRRLHKELCVWKPALLQTFLFHANLIGRIAGRCAGVPKIVSGIRVAEKRSRVHLWLDRVTNRWVDCNVCVSQAVADFSIQLAGLASEKTIVIPNGVEFQRFASAQPADLSQLGIPTEGKVMIFVGRLDPQKGLLTLIRAMPQLIERHNTLQAVLVGEGPQRDELEQTARNLGVHESVVFAGWRNDVPELLRASDLFVLPSLWEGMANVVLEAMAAGLPVVASQVEGTQEQIQSGETGLLFEPGSVEGFIEAVSTILDRPDDAQRMADSAQNISHKEFTWDAVVIAYEQLFRNLLAK